MIRDARFDLPVMQSQTSSATGCGCGPRTMAREAADPFLQPFVIGSVETDIGLVPRVAERLTARDRWGRLKVRWGVGRLDYTVEPGLYAVSEPDRSAPVLVTANYKLSFDCLRTALGGRPAWILVLETFGINVWCAAGKGTFCTDELVLRLEAVGMKRVVDHRRVVVPQLGAPSVAGFRVREKSGFKVVWGPIRAVDLPEFLDRGMKASPEMRNKTFELRERMALVPVELVAATKPVAAAAAGALLVGALWSGEGWAAGVVNHGVTGVLAILGGVLAGAVLTPLLLPWLPGRAFALKGLWVGVVVAGAVAAIRGDLTTTAASLETVSWIVLGVVVSTFLAMNFTGASTFTSHSGVTKEMRVAVPLQIAGAVLGVALLVAGRICG